MIKKYAFPFLIFWFAGCTAQRQYAYEVELYNVCGRPIHVVARYGYGTTDQELNIGEKAEILRYDYIYRHREIEVLPPYRLEISANGSKRVLDETQLASVLKKAKLETDDKKGRGWSMHFFYRHQNRPL
jgi:hypothetical protein